MAEFFQHPHTPVSAPTTALRVPATFVPVPNVAFTALLACAADASCQASGLSGSESSMPERDPSNEASNSIRTNEVTDGDVSLMRCLLAFTVRSDKAAADLGGSL